MDSIFIQLGLIIIVSAAMGIVARVLKQPIILAYIAAGILIGAGGYNLIPDTVQTEDIATVGIIFLLFLIGLELDIRQVKRVGHIVLITGLIQMLVVAAAASGLTVALGYSPMTALFIGLAASFSSTAVVLKRLIDRRELSSLHGRVSVGILLLQDLVAIVALMLISAANHGGLDPSSLIWLLLKGGLFIVGTWLITKYLLGRIFFYIAQSTELLFLASVAWAFLFAIVSDQLGFSKEIGAFVAGISLATLPYNLEIIGRVKPLKDFFLIIFFVVLGLEISWPVIGENWPLILGVALLVLFLKTFVTSLTMVRLGYPKRPAYLTGAGLGQMSEFSLLIALLATSTGLIDHSVVAIMAALLVVTIVLNTYWFGLNRYVYPILVKPLVWFGNGRQAKELHYRPDNPSGHILLFGANRVGAALIDSLKQQDRDLLVVDHNPDVIRRLQRQHIESVYGDIDDYDLLWEMGLDRARTIVSTVPNVAANLYLIRTTRKHNPKAALIITTAEQIEDALEMYEAGADYVIVPHLVGGEQAARLLEEAGSRQGTGPSVRQRRREHITHLKKRHRQLHA